MTPTMLERLELELEALEARLEAVRANSDPGSMGGTVEIKGIEEQIYSVRAQRARGQGDVAGAAIEIELGRKAASAKAAAAGKVAIDAIRELQQEQAKDDAVRQRLRKIVPLKAVT